MAVLGCTNPKAVNFNPAADTDDGTCVYLASVGEICYQFKDVPANQMVDRSFTLSWAVEGDNWVFYHDYLPDMYFSTREQLHALKQNKIYHMNRGPVGQYFDATKKPFFIDVVAKTNEELTLNTVNWITEMFDQLGTPLEQKTFTHITVWNSYQCTGRIELQDNFELLEYKNKRRTIAQWSFNNFRNELRERGIVFLQDIFHNFDIIPGSIDAQKGWFDRDLMEDEFFIIRLEFDNVENNNLFLHDVDGDTSQSFR